MACSGGSNDTKIDGALRPARTINIAQQTSNASNATTARYADLDF